MMYLVDRVIWKRELSGHLAMISKRRGKDRREGERERGAK